MARSIKTKLQDMTEPEIREIMAGLGHEIIDSADRIGVEKPLFVLLLFNDPRVGQYIANTNRSDTILALREAADRLENNQDIPRD